MTDGKGWHLGVDTGGTFTDFVAVELSTGRILTFKVPSRAHAPADAVGEGLERLSREHAVDGAAIRRFVFGTTVATNAILERKGARTALVTTRGVRDVLEIQRMWRHRLFDLELAKPEPLVARRHRLECAERIGADGQIVERLGDAEAARVAAAVAGLGVEAVAVCLLFSFLAPEHERRLAAALAAAAPELDVTLSSDICPEFREYERTCTTVMNACVTPKVRELANRLGTLIGEHGVEAPLRIMQSNGGLMSTARAATQPVHTLLSGPAGGVVGAVELARAAGFGDVVTMDMGGTSLDVSLVQAGAVQLFPEGRLGGFPVKIAQVDVHTIGAGGGSIARVERGALLVGPQSAGADPGPACYGRGGDVPTSTDCALALGLIDPRYFVGGEIALDEDAARAAIERGIARPLGFDVEQAALAAIEVQVASMATGVRAVTVERGLDPRDFALLCFGGAGGLYAGLVAEELGMRTVVVPVHAGVLSALGLLMSDVKCTQSLTRLLREADADSGTLAGIFAELDARLAEEVARDGLDAARLDVERSCDMRYVGQAYEVRVPVDGAAPRAADLATRFHDEHRRLYGSASPGDAVELVAFRAFGRAALQRPTLARVAAAETEPVPKSRRSIRFRRGGQRLATPIFERASLGAGHRIEGPAVLEEPGATTVVLPGHRALIDAHGNVIVSVGARARRAADNESAARTAVAGRVT